MEVLLRAQSVSRLLADSAAVLDGWFLSSAPGTEVEQVDTTTWSRVLGDAILVRSNMDGLDRLHLFPYHLPRGKLTAAALNHLEGELGRKLDPQYRAFLSMAGGWPGFYQCVDLFGPLELTGGGSAPRGRELLDVAEGEGILPDLTIPRSSAQVIAVSTDAIDVFILVMAGSPLEGQVIWLAGGEIERFAGFDEFFLSMVEYNRRRLAKWSNSYP